MLLSVALLTEYFETSSLQDASVFRLLVDYFEISSLQDTSSLIYLRRFWLEILWQDSFEDACILRHFWLYLFSDASVKIHLEMLLS